MKKIKLELDAHQAIEFREMLFECGLDSELTTVYNILCRTVAMEFAFHVAGRLSYITNDKIKIIMPMSVAISIVDLFNAHEFSAGSLYTCRVVLGQLDPVIPAVLRARNMA